MGGRGGYSGNKSTSPIIANKPQTIKTEYISKSAKSGGGIYGAGGGYYKDKVLEATSDKYGNVTFSYAKGQFSDDRTKIDSRRSSVEVTYSLKAGAINGTPFGIDWSKVNSISGETYDFRKYAKQAGLKWNGKKWSR